MSRKPTSEAQPSPPALPADVYPALFEAMPDAMLVVDGDGVIVLANAQTRAVFGYERDELLGMPVEMLMPERYRQAHLGHRAHYVGEPRTRPMGLGLELRARHRKGHEFPVEISLSTFERQGERLVAAAVRDVSDRKRLEEAVRRIEERLQVALERSPTAVFEQDQELRYLWVHNPPAGLDAAALVGRTDAEVFAAADAARLVEIKKRVLAEGKDLREEVPLHLGGEQGAHHFDLYVRPRRDAEGKVRGLTAAMTDITERKRAEEELSRLNSRLEQLVLARTGELVAANAELAASNRERARLYQALLQAQEQERARISRDLHDGIGQALTGMMLLMEEAEGEDEAVRRRRLKALAARTLAEVRRLSHDLRPSLLDALGLEAALKQYGREVAARSGFSVEVVVHLNLTLPPEYEITLFRICQEALTNVARHAEAKHASVVLTEGAEGVRLVIEDDGVGFDPKQVAGRHFGLAGIRERVELLGGELRIEGAVGLGTSLHVRLPRPA